MLEKLHNNYKIRNIFIFSFLTIILIFFAMNGFTKYNINKNKMYEKVDKTLKDSALMGNLMLTSDFYERALFRDSISQEEDRKNIETLSQVAKTIEVAYIYTMIQKGDEIYFTSSSATFDDIKQNSVTYYFDQYEEATPLLKTVLKNNQIVYEESEDKWGKFRSIYIPFTTANGTKYIVGADIKVDAIEQELNRMLMQTLTTFSFLILLIVTGFIIYINISKKELKTIAIVQKELKQAIRRTTSELKILNETLQERVEQEVAKNIKQEILLHEKSRLAAVGSMISNIIHQWKQPLSYLGTTATAVQFKISLHEKTELTQYISKEMQDIYDGIMRLNETLSTFKNFLQEKKEKKRVILQDSINSALIIVNAVLKDNHITLENNIDNIAKLSITTISPELTEVIINIVNNAKDALIEQKIYDPWIRINLTKNDTHAIITIEDNGGGISEEILPNIFDENFTTKDELHGTGIGLYMSKMIIEESLGGKIYANNGIQGALFFIELPLDLN